MRELRFRAWDKTKNIMILPEFSDWEDFMIEPDGSVSSSYETGTYETYRSKRSVDYEIMQYTGLKDRHGKEIYEGDIIALDDIKCPITWNDGGFQMITSANQGKSNALQDRTKYFEIIGNIHEHKHLLK